VQENKKMHKINIYLKNIRQVTNVFTKPFHTLLNLPSDIYNFTTEYFSNQSRLIDENEALKLNIDSLKADLQRLDFIDQENNQLKNLLEVKNAYKFKTEAVSIIYSRFDPFNQKIIIDGGQNKDFQAGQPVINALGLVGQISSVFPETSEVTLIVDKKMSVPIQIQRNGLRAITNGNGQDETILLSYLYIFPTKKECLEKKKNTNHHHVPKSPLAVLAKRSVI
jgi:rod shape-determining protein MreC